MSVQKIPGKLKLITCVLYKGGGDKVLKALYHKGITNTSLAYSRGSSIGDPVENDGLPKTFSKEIVTVVVNASEADEIFEYIYEVADINRPHGGLLYMEKIDNCTLYTLPEAPVEFDTSDSQTPTSP